MEEKKQAQAALTIDRAAFLLLRVKKVFRKKKQQRKESKNAQLAAAAAVTEQQRGSTPRQSVAANGSGRNKPPPPLLRSRTLPAIVVPGISILQAQIDASRQQDGLAPYSTNRYGSHSGRSSARISFSDDSGNNAGLKAEEIGRRKSAVSRLCVGSAFGSPTERHSDGSLVLRVPAPHVVAARAYRMSASGPSGSLQPPVSPNTATPPQSSGSSTNTALYRLARLLNQGTSKTLQQPSPNDDGSVIRRLSWERRDTNAGQNAARLPRSSSIDSMVEAVWSESNSLSPYPPYMYSSRDQPPLSGAARPLSLVSPSVGRRVKGQRSINELQTLESAVSDDNNLNGAPRQLPSITLSSVLPSAGTKTTKKQAKLMQQRLEKLARINIHLHALFAAIEHGHLEKARTILESTDVDVNSVNADGLSPLDVAVLSNNRPLAKMLISFGAREGNQFSCSEKLNNHLNGLLSEAEIRLQELGVAGTIPDMPSGPRASFSSIMSSAYPASTMTGCAGGGDSDKQAGVWGRRARGLQRLLLGLNQARPPDPPQVVQLDITGTSTVAITLKEPTPQDYSITTKFKIQWATRSDFSNICGEREILDLQNPKCFITDLNPGTRYYFRAACGNLKGFGSYKMSSPASCIPSSWREVDNRDLRFCGRLRMLDDLFSEVRSSRPIDASELPSLDSNSAQTRRAQKKKTTIKQLFTAASKFQKHLRRGVYLACILYHEDKVLVTNEEFLPVIEVDETYPGCLNNDYHWLMKVACTWDDVKSLRTDMEKNSSSAVHFRTKLLAAACQMQSALCIQDLGQLFHKPLKDSQGTIVISTINSVKSPKSISVLNSRWLPLNKVHKKLNVLTEENNVGEILMSSIQEQINYHQASSVQLPKGLYLGYLKMQSSVDLIQVVVPTKTPNVLPHFKVRDNPHVSAEEWHHIKTHHNHRLLHKTASDPTPFLDSAANEQQKIFLEQIRVALKRLFSYMDLSLEDALTHRLYDYEVIELTSEVSFIIVCPSAEMSCCVPGQREILLQRGDLLSLPIQAFEMIHLNTYQNHIIQRYSRLSCVLELDNILANHVMREAFSTSELAVAKERLAKLSELQTKLNNIWKTVRWLMDAISFARERGANGILIRQILDMQDTNNCNEIAKMNANSLKRSLLQIPPRDPKLVKSSPGRGSWPGPAASNNLSAGNLNTEFSKSEQHLSITPNDASSLNLSSQYLSATSDNETSRKSSIESYKNTETYLSDSAASVRLPPSRSEDTLLLAHKPVHSRTRSKSSTIVTSVSANTSPLLHINAKPMYSGSLLSVNTVNTTHTSDSMHSLSSDSEGASCPLPLGASTPRKIKKTSLNIVNSIAPSISMLNVKTAVEPKIKIDNVISNLDPRFGSNYTNLETTSSKSLTNIRSGLEESSKQLFLKPAYHAKKSNNDLTSIHDTKYKKGASYSTKIESATASTSNESCPTSPQPGILQVYAAYETGLASGTSLKLHVTPRTTAREVVDLVVKQLNMAVVLKGKDGPVYTSDKLRNFCLVAVIGARERCLRDDFKPLQLQNPWKKGRLYVRQKQDVLAALEHSSKHSAIL